MKNITSILLYFFVYAAVQVVVPIFVIAGYTVAGHQADATTGQGLVISMGIAIIVGVALFCLLRWYPLSASFFKKENLMVMLLSALMAMAMLLPSTWMEEIIPDEFMTDLVGEQMEMIINATGGYLVVCLLAPVGEELVFRGAIQRKAMAFFKEKNELKGNPGVSYHWKAIVLSAFLFALIHMNPAQMPHAFLIGLLLGWLCHKTGSIVPGIIVHWVNNSMAYVLYRLVPGATDMKVIDLFSGSHLWLCVALMVSIFVFVPSLIAVNKNANH